MMYQLRSPTSISPILLCACCSFSPDRSQLQKSIPGDDEVLVVVLLQIVLVIVPDVAAILRYCFFRSWAPAAIIKLTELSMTKRPTSSL